MKCMIFAAGFGTRLQPITQEWGPKPLLPILNRPAISYLLDHLVQEGIRSFVINLHHGKGQLKSFLDQEKKRLNIDIDYSIEYPKILGTAGGLYQASSFLGTEDNYLVINADILTNISIKSLLQQHHSQKALATLALKRGNKEPFSAIKFNEGAIVGIMDRNLRDGEYFFEGIQVVTDKIFPFLKGKFCIIKDGYIPLLSRGEKLSSYMDKSLWLEFGTPKSYFQTNMYFLSLLLKGEKPSHFQEYQEIKKGTFIGKNSTLGTHVTLHPPVIIGHQVKIDSGSIGPEVIIGDQTIIEKIQKMEKTIVLPRSHVRGERSFQQQIVWNDSHTLSA